MTDRRLTSPNRSVVTGMFNTPKRERLLAPMSENPPVKFRITVDGETSRAKFGDWVLPPVPDSSTAYCDAVFHVKPGAYINYWECSVDDGPWQKISVWSHPSEGKTVLTITDATAGYLRGRRGHAEP